MVSIRTYMTSTNTWSYIKENEPKLPHRVRQLILALKIRNIPYREHNDRLKCIFIHIPKTAGSSIVRSIGAEGVRHVPADIFNLADAVRFEKYFKFTFVRNPYDRFVSAFSYLQKQRLGKGRDAIWADKNIANTTINEFVYTLERPLVAKRVLRFVHLIPQYKWLSDEELDFVGRFENLEYDFRYVAKVLDIDPVLQHARRSEHGPYHEHLNKRSMSVINNLYYEDFKRFGY